MGTESVGVHFNDATDGIPPVPPGFSSLKSFTLRRVQDDAMAPENDSYTVQCIIPDEKSRKSLLYRPWVNYSGFENSSDEVTDYEFFEQDVPSSPCLPKGVLRGCTECKTCQKVTARWHPQDACKPTLDEAPVFYPSEEEFKDTLEYIASIRPSAEQYGICRIIPPSSWRPPCLFKEKNVWENSKFTTRIQQLDKLQNCDSLKKINKNHSIMRTKRRKLLKMGDNGDETMLEVKQLRYRNSSERFGFEPGPDFTLESFQKYADDFKEQYFDTNADFDLMCGQEEPSVENIEGEYWRIVERPTEEIEVLYGADLDTGVFGSGFPKASSSLQNSELEDQHINSGWNLNNLARFPGSVLSFESGEIPGVLVPWLYIGMCFSSFCWHVEDHHLYSLNYLHWGAPKVWYGVPGKNASKLEEAMKKHLPRLFEEQPDLLHNLVTQFSPSLLRLEEAVNVAPLDWLPHGQNAVELYCEQRRKTSLSHDKLLLGAAREAVRAQWNVLFWRKNTLDKARWKNFCGSDGILAKALKARIEMEHLRREYLCSSQSQKMDAVFDANTERECTLCHYDLHLSAASCLCSPDRFSCLMHAKNLCSCAWSTRIFLFRYDISELNVLLDAVRGKLSAVHRWGISDLGLSLSSYISKEKTQESKLISVTNKEGREKKNNQPIREEPCRRVDKSFQSSGHKRSNMTSSFYSVQQEVKRFRWEGTKNTTLLQRNSNSMDEMKQFSSSPTVITGSELNLSSVQEDTILSGGNEHKATKGNVSDEMRIEPPEKNIDIISRSMYHDDKLTSCNFHKDQVLLMPWTTALLASEDPLTVPEVSHGSSNLILVDDDDQVEENCCEDLSNVPGQQLVEFLPEKATECVKYATRVTDTELNADILPAKEASDCGTASTHHQTPQHSGSGKLEDESKGRGSELNSECNLLGRGNSGAAVPFCTQRSLDRYKHQQNDPKMAKVVQRINFNVEVLAYGVILSGKLWSMRQAIFPKGYRSRVKYLSVLDPTQMCYYISAILDAGSLGPLFMVMVEQCPSEVFVHVSATKCWDMVRERVNHEIKKQHNMGRLNLSSLQLPGSVDGLEMFGLLSPAVIRAIEALDQDHVCTEYWSSRPKALVPPDPAIMSTDHRPGVNNEQCISERLQPAASKLAVRALFKKANPEELHALHSLLNDDLINNSRQELIQLLNEEIGNRHS